MIWFAGKLPKRGQSRKNVIFFISPYVLTGYLCSLNIPLKEPEATHRQRSDDDEQKDLCDLGVDLV